MNKFCRLALMVCCVALTVASALPLPEDDDAPAPHEGGSTSSDVGAKGHSALGHFDRTHRGKPKLAVTTTAKPSNPKPVKERVRRGKPNSPAEKANPTETTGKPSSPVTSDKPSPPVTTGKPKTTTTTEKPTSPVKERVRRGKSSPPVTTGKPPKHT